MSTISIADQSRVNDLKKRIRRFTAATSQGTLSAENIASIGPLLASTVELMETLVRNAGRSESQTVRLHGHKINQN